MTTTVLRIEYQSQDEKARRLIAILSAMGYRVERTTLPAVTIPELAARVGRHPRSISRSLRRVSCPPFEAKRGRRRIITLVPNDRLIAFLTAY